MADKKTFTKPINDLLALARQSLDTLGNANQIVYGGVQKFADSELKALNDYYKAAVTSLKKAQGDKNLKGAAQRQADLLQDAVNKLIGNARASLSVVSDARAELAKLVKGGASGGPLSAAKLEKALAPAQKALEKIKAEALKAGAKASDTVKTAKKDIKAEVAKAEKSLKADVKAVKKEVKAVKKSVSAEAKKIGKAVKTEVKAAKKTARSVEAKVVKAARSVEKTVEEAARSGVEEARKVVSRAVPTPSPNSRASRATSAAKKVVTTATDAVDVAKAKAGSAAAAVATAVETAVETVKTQG